MSGTETTCWLMIQGAASGRASDRDLFVRRYESVMRAYLTARWQGTPLEADLDDAMQDIFAECFRAGGVLERAEQGSPGGFRAFLFGVVRNVARRFETARARERQRRTGEELDLDQLAGSEDTLSGAFDRIWAKQLLHEAWERMVNEARSRGPRAMARVELLRSRFQGIPVREIAERWRVDRDWLHHQDARARAEFRLAFRQTVAFYNPGASDAEVAQMCLELLMPRS